MNGEYTIHKLEEEDFNLLIPLMQDCFGKSVNVNYFEWKYKLNPAGFVYGFYAKHMSGDIAAYYGAIPEHYFIDGRQCIIYQSCDTMTSSRHRRKGLFKELAVHCYESLRREDKLFVVGFGGKQSTPGFIKFGWQEIFKMRSYFFPRQFRILGSIKHDGVEMISDYNRIEHLLTESNNSTKIHSAKNSRIFRWRVSNPQHQYITVGVKGKDGSFESYLTYYYDQDKIILFDFYFSTKSSGKNLVNYLKSKLSNEYKGIVMFVQESSTWVYQIRRHGFIANPFNMGPLHERVPFIFYASEEVMSRYANPKNWNINAFDHDAI